MSIPYTSDSQLPLFTPETVHSDTTHNTPHQRLLENDNNLQSQITAVAGQSVSWDSVTGKPNLLDYTLGMYNYYYPTYYPTYSLYSVYGSTGGSYITYPITHGQQYIIGSYTNWYWQNGNCSPYPCAVLGGGHVTFYRLYTTGIQVTGTGSAAGQSAYNFQMTVAPVAGSNWTSNPNRYASSFQASISSPSAWGPISTSVIYEFNGANGANLYVDWYKTSNYTYYIKLRYARYDSRQGLSIRSFLYYPAGQAFVTYSTMGQF